MAVDYEATETTIEISYAVGQYGIVAHIVDPDVIDRTLCRIRVGRYVSAEILQRFNVCYTCEKRAREMGILEGER